LDDSYSFTISHSQAKMFEMNDFVIHVWMTIEQKYGKVLPNSGIDVFSPNPDALVCLVMSLPKTSFQRNMGKIKVYG